MLPEGLVQSSHVPLFLDGGRAYPAQLHMVPGDGLLKAVPPDIGRSRMSPAVQRPALSKVSCEGHMLFLPPEEDQARRSSWPPSLQASAHLLI